MECAALIPTVLHKQPNLPIFPFRSFTATDLAQAFGLRLPNEVVVPEGVIHCDELCIIVFLCHSDTICEAFSTFMKHMTSNFLVSCHFLSIPIPAGWVAALPNDEQYSSLD